MGALTSSGNKREPEFQSPLPSEFDYDNNFHISKKLRSSYWSSSSFRDPTKSPVSRLNRYPQQLIPITREIHAPSRFVNGFTRRLGASGSRSRITRVKSGVFGDRMGNFLFSEYRSTKEAGISGCRDVMFRKEDGDVDDDVRIVNDSVAMAERETEDVNKSRELETVISKYRELDGKTEVVSNLVNGRSDDGLPLYKKLLLYIAEKIDPAIRRLSFGIKLQEAKRGLWQQLGAPKKEEDTIPIETFRPLTEDEMKMVDNAFANSTRRKVLVTHESSNIIITGEVLRCLRLGAWLNDEVINVYLELLKEREKKEPQKFLKCHFFSTFFYKKLTSGRIGYDYKSVRRWTTQKKLGYSLFESFKQIFVPVHKEIHWCLAVINKKEAKFQYLDSLGGFDEHVMSVLAKYIVDEVKDKNGKDIDVTSWKQEYVKDLPKQENGNDCGVFMIKYADFYSRDIGLCFKQEHMPYFRRRTAMEILRLKAE
ncbi:hypothetical protein OSB04_022039 [Centaurea solstitialis]|uniref:Ubiquitin-like protease family profile domain-containing protein n=1 Tax=Centaurea solstitialis TaxID=347529 RepID=A0AA38T8S3_9ASTR|nr:hypothetical protein OSB04_022039 [Centaurea solstitialis]